MTRLVFLSCIFFSGELKEGSTSSSLPAAVPGFSTIVIARTAHQQAIKLHLVVSIKVLESHCAGVHIHWRNKLGNLGLELLHMQDVRLRIGSVKQPFERADELERLGKAAPGRRQ